VMWVMWNLLSVRFEIVLASVQDNCTICAKHSIGSEIVLGTPGGTLLGDKAQVEARFSSFGDRANLDAR
jgi:uncharacterized membrane protein